MNKRRLSQRGFLASAAAAVAAPDINSGRYPVIAADPAECFERAIRLVPGGNFRRAPGDSRRS